MSRNQRTFSKDEYKAEFRVPPEYDGMRLDQFLKAHMGTLSRNFLTKKIEKGDIQIIGREEALKPSTKVRLGQMVILKTYKTVHEQEFWNGEEIAMEEELEIVYENDDLIAISKPPFMATHPTGRHLFYCATIYVEKMLGHKIHSVHRIDRETSGVLLFAKNSQVAGQLTTLFEQKENRKVYFLIGKKVVDRDYVDFVAHEPLLLIKDPDDISRILVDESVGSRSKSSTTHFYPLFQNQDYMIALAMPLTGRQHQIRVHAAHHGFPLIGDKLYLGDRNLFYRFKDNELKEADYKLLEIPRHALHALALSLPEPFNLEMKTAIPKDLRNWMLEKKFNMEQIEKDTELKIAQLFKV